MAGDYLGKELVQPWLVTLQRFRPSDTTLATASAAIRTPRVLVRYDVPTEIFLVTPLATANRIHLEGLRMIRILIVVVAFAATSSVAIAQGIAVTLSEWKVGMASDTVRAGSVTFSVKNTGSMTHAFSVKGEGVDKGTREIPANQSATLTLTLKPGTYEVFCPMSEESHKMAGMARKLVVTPGDASSATKPPGA